MTAAVLGSSLSTASPLRRQTELVRMSAIRQLKTRYRGTSLGVLWSFANPVLMTLIYTAVFGTAFASYYGGSTTAYLVSAFAGVVVVTFFLQTTTDAMSSVVANGGLLNKIAIPPHVFPLSSIAANAFQQIITTFPVLMLVAALVTHDARRVLLLPFALAGVLLISAGFSLALSALYVYFRDLPYLWSVASFILWLTCPVFYPAAVVPPGVRIWMEVNPLGITIAAIRELSVTTGPLALRPLAIFAVVAVLVAAAGAVTFMAVRSDFMDLL